MSQFADTTPRIRQPRIGERGTIFNKLLYAVRKYHVRDVGPQAVAEGITEALKARGIDATISHGYLNKVENGSVRIPNEHFITGVTDYFNEVCWDKWGDVLAFAFKVVVDDLTCSGAPFAMHEDLKDLILRFERLSCYVGTFSQIDKTFLKQIKESSDQPNRLVQIDLAWGTFSFDPAHQGYEEMIKEEYLRRQQEFCTNEFVIFDDELLVLHFASTPVFVTDRSKIVEYRNHLRPR